MDIKMDNIMVIKDLQLKIFDFTESYHPKICTEGNFRFKI